MKKASKCEECIHDKVCGLKEAYSRCCSEVYTGNTNVSVEIKCDHFKPYARREDGIQSGEFGWRG